MQNLTEKLNSIINMINEGEEYFIELEDRMKLLIKIRDQLIQQMKDFKEGDNGEVFEDIVLDESDNDNDDEPIFDEINKNLKSSTIVTI